MREPASPLSMRLLTGLLASALCVAGGCSSPAPAAKNVVLITLDALRQDHISAFGYFRPTTPNIDWLAENGVALRNVIPTGCSTLMSLTSLLTSRPFAASQIEGSSILRDANVTLAETFAAAGYRTAGFVASPVLVAETRFGQGFQTYEDFNASGHTYVKAELPVKAAIEYLRSQEKGSPLFLYLHLEEPHPPWLSASPWLHGDDAADRFFGAGCTYMPTAEELAALDDRAKRNLIAKYDGAIRYADEQIGVLLRELRAQGQLANTIIAVATDHGIELVDRYSATHGHNPFDEVVRGFLVLFADGVSFDDDIVGVQGRIFDIGPTLLGLAGIGKPSSAEGVDLLKSAADLPRYAFTRCYNADVVRSLDHKLISVEFSLARRKGDHLPVGLEEGIQLFDLRVDPKEKRDVKDSHPEQLQAMTRALQEYRRSIDRELSEPWPSAARELDPRTRERLRALGYD